MEWVRGAKIGRGSSAVVHLAFRRSSTPAPFAVKSAPLSASSLLQREESILADLQHCPEIVACFGHQVTTEPPGGGPVYNVFLEYAAGGTVSDAILRAGGGGLPEPTVRRHLRSILLGLRHIHTMGYVHCDIKPQNILLSGGGSGVQAKIADFGLSKKAGEPSDLKIRGTPMYLAPESAARKEYEAPADIWALGCTAAEMFSGCPPWRGTDVTENGIWALMLRIGFGDELPEIPPAMSEEGKDFLRRCFSKEPSKRWTAEMLLSHPFIASSSDLESEEESVFLVKSSRTDPSPRSVLGYSFSSILSLPQATEMADLTTLVFDEEEPRERIRGLATDERRGWKSSSTEEEGWINVREESTSGEVNSGDEDVFGRESSCFGDTVQLCLPPFISVSRSVSENREGFNCEGEKGIFSFAELPCNGFLSH